MHMHSSGWSTTYTPRHVATMLCMDPNCCARMYVYTVPWLNQSQRVNYTAVLKYVKSHWYPKSMINIQTLLSLQVAVWAIERQENWPFFDDQKLTQLKNSTPLLFNLAIVAFFRAHQWPLRSITHWTINIGSIYNYQGGSVMFETTTCYWHYILKCELWVQTTLIRTGVTTKHNIMWITIRTGVWTVSVSNS